MTDVKDFRLLSPTQLLYHAIGKPHVDHCIHIENEVTCPLCGLPTQQIVGWKVPAKFSDLDLFAEKENLKYLCPACSFTLGHIKDLHKAYFLSGNKGFNVLQFDDQNEKKIGIGKKEVVSRYYLKELLLNPPMDDPWILMLQSKMNPQHSLMRAKVNYGQAETVWVSNGTSSCAIPRTGLIELLTALEKIKLSDSLYPYLFTERPPSNKHKEISIWEEVEPIISKHRYTHYLTFLYDRIIPPKKYIQEQNT